MDCKDAASDKLGPTASENDKQNATASMEKCVVKCVDTHIQLMPTMLTRVTKTIAQQNK